MNNEWISSAVGEGWIFGILSLVSAFIIIIIKRKPPNRIVVEEVRAEKLLEIPDSIKSKVQVHYNSNVITDIGKFEARIYNQGEDPIKAPNLQVNFKKNTVVLDYQFEGVNHKVCCVASIEENTLKVNIPYLNSKKSHKQITKLTVLLSGCPHATDISGGGEGWSVKFHGLLHKMYTEKVKIFLFIVGSIISIVIPLLFWGNTESLKLIQGIFLGIFFGGLFASISEFRNFLKAYKDLKSELSNINITRDRKYITCFLSLVFIAVLYLLCVGLS
jgi:hypothetical protein